MRLEQAMFITKEDWNTLDILEILGIKLSQDYENLDYYKDKIKSLPTWEYFISDLDWTFFRWMLQKEAVSLFIKFVVSREFYNTNPEEFFDFIKDLDYFNKLEKQALNKENSYSDYLNAGIFLLLKHKNLVDWEDFLIFIRSHFKSKEKIKPFRFSINKMKEVLENGKIFLFVSGAPDFIFEIYLELLKVYLEKNIWEQKSKNIFWLSTNITWNGNFCAPMWWRDNKIKLINLLKDKKIITKTIWWMWDTWADFWISASLDKWNNFYFINPEKKVIQKFDELKVDWIKYKMIFERKDLVCEFDRESVKFVL